MQSCFTISKQRVKLLLFIFFTVSQADVECNYNGHLEQGSCVCRPGFGGNECQHCYGRFMFNESSGEFSSGPPSEHFVDCLGIILPTNRSNSSVIRLHIDNVASSCQGDYLTIYDGDSIQAPILATFTGDISSTQSRLLVTQSDAITFNFYNSEEVFRFAGYHISYSVEQDSNPTKQDFEVSNITCESSWCRYKWKGSSGRASAAMTSHGNFAYLFGGKEFGQDDHVFPFMRLNLTSLQWTAVNTQSTEPDMRQGHTLVTWKETLFLFGGKLSNYTITNQLWEYNLTEEKWSRSLVSNKSEEAPSLTGHSAHVVTLASGRNVMLVFFGYSPEWEISSFVFEMDLESREWTRLDTTGTLPLATYKHASVLDERSNVVFLHGGYNLTPLSKLYSYDVNKKQWNLLLASPEPRYLHSMTMLGENLYVFGRSGKNCVSKPALKYDTVCRKWNSLNASTAPLGDRYGHSTIALDNRRMLVCSGYDGTMLSDAIIYEPDAMTSGRWNETQCLKNSCSWVRECCSCTPDEDPCDDLCSSATSCGDCCSLSCPCYYDDDQGCQFRSSDVTTATWKMSQCNVSACDGGQEDARFCHQQTTCAACQTAGCYWNRFENACYVNISGEPEVFCRETCYDVTSCESCIDTPGCAWCRTEGTCFRQKDWEIVFPFGECPEVGGCSGNQCSLYQNCDSCFKNVQCGWCDYGSTSGFGLCLTGSLSGPNNQLANCSVDEWNYLSCPACQCNGHSNCSVEYPSNCTSCETGTTGPTCGECDVMHFGDPTNGRECENCVCHGHADSCSDQGKCSCNVEGITGKNCDECFNGFNGNPINDTCRYTMKVMTRYKFPLYEKSAVTKFNFESCPPYDSDVIVNLDTSNGQTFGIVITTNYTSADSNETEVYTATNVTSISETLPHDQFQFGSGTCIRIYVSSLQLPTQITISLINNSFDFWKLVVVFLVTLIILLILAAAVWKVSSYVIRIRRRRNREQEIVRLASRPLVSVDFDALQQEVGARSQVLIAQEACRNDEASVYTLLLRLPGDQPPTLALGSCLVKNRSASDLPEENLPKKKRKKRFKGLGGSSQSQSGIENPNYRQED